MSVKGSVESLNNWIHLRITPALDLTGAVHSNMEQFADMPFINRWTNPGDASLGERALSTDSQILICI